VLFECQQQTGPDFSFEQHHDTRVDPVHCSCHEGRHVKWEIGDLRFDVPAMAVDIRNRKIEDFLALERVGGQDRVNPARTGKGLEQFPGQIRFAGRGRLDPDIGIAFQRASEDTVVKAYG